MCKAAYRHSSTQRLPAHALRKLRDHRFKRNTFEDGAACGFIGCVHVSILDRYFERLQYRMFPGNPLRFPLIVSVDIFEKGNGDPFIPAL